MVFAAHLLSEWKLQNEPVTDRWHHSAHMDMCTERASTFISNWPVQLSDSATASVGFCSHCVLCLAGSEPLDPNQDC